MNDPRPQTLDEALNWLLENVSPDDLNTIRDTPYKDLIQFHHSFGQYIRNKLGLWTEEQKGFVALLCENSGTEYGPHPDDASGEIIEALWTTLQARG